MTATTTARPVSLHLSKAAWVTFWVLILVPWGLVFWLQHRWNNPPPRRAASVAATNHLDSVQVCRPGPWGRLEYVPIVLEPPDELVPYDFRAEPQRWQFNGWSRSTASAWVEKLSLTPAQQLMLAKLPWEDTPAGAVLQPSREFILSLSTEARSALYTHLGQFPENPAIHNAFRFAANRVDAILAGTRLAPETVALVKPLFYRLGNALAFADGPTVLAMLPSAEEQRNLFKVLAHKPALLARLQVPPGAETAGWAAYWSAGGRAKDVGPVLASLARQEQGGTIDILHLLPPQARARINTFPLPANGALQTPWDCHWTSLNFFREKPDDSFGTTAGAIQEIQEHYHPVMANPRLGDLLLFFDERGGVFHSCVYIADEIVFGKNGPLALAPWALMLLSDVVATYESGQKFEIRVYRRNET